MCVCVLGLKGRVDVITCVKSADNGCEGQFIAFSFRGERIVHPPSQVTVLFARPV